MKRVLFFLFAAFTGLVTYSQNNGFENFITVSGNKLMDGQKEFRFISFNIPNLNFVEDEMAFGKPHAFGLPVSFEILDAMNSVKQMGGQVIRLYTFPVKRSDEPASVPKYVTGPGEFDKHSFLTMDSVLALANKTGVRLIVSFLNNWKWMGGRPQYAEFRGKTQDDFWTDPQLIKDFEKTINYVINRINTVTGIKYKDDKAILSWETGNELSCPVSWTTEICRYIKSLDKNHLVMDGFDANGNREIREESVEDPNIDIISSHHYETDPAKVIAHIKTNDSIINGRKPYIIGEFGFLSTTAISHILDKIIENERISGAFIWSLRYHRAEGGYYWHSEPAGLGLYKAYHWPGFRSGNKYDEINLLNVYREKAYRIRGMEVPEIPAPESPTLLAVKDAAHITWQGSAGASSYDIQRAEKINGPWKTIGYSVSDAAVQYFPLYSDETAKPGNIYYYRVTAKNNSGMSSPSNIQGPVKINHFILIDNADNFGKLYHKSDKISIVTNDDRKFKEDMYRLKGEKDDFIIYRVNGYIKGFKVYSFALEKEPALSVSLSKNGKEYNPELKLILKSEVSAGDYGYWIPATYETDNVNGEFHYLKLKFNDLAEIGRIEIYY